MDNKEAIKSISKSQHEIWKVRHYIKEKYNDPIQLKRISRSQYEIWNVKNWLQNQIESEPEEELSILPKKYHVNQLKKRFGYPIYVGAFHAKCLFINAKEYPWQKKKDFIDMVVKNVFANNIRGYAYLPYPKQCYMPHPLETRMINGKTVTKYNIEKINPEWLDIENKGGELYRVGKYCYDRRLHIRLTFADSSATTVSKRRWNDHWLNPENNWGFHGKETYPDHYGLLKWMNVMYGGLEVTPKEREGLETNGAYFLWFLPLVFNFLHTEFKDFLTVEMNEIDTGDIGHKILGQMFHRGFDSWITNALKKIVGKSRGFPRWRMISSPRGREWINSKPNINKYWIPSVHGIQDEISYAAAVKDLKYKTFPSGDGGGNAWYKGGYKGLRRLTRLVLRDKSYGLDGNNWLPDDCNFTKIDHKSGEAMMEEVDRFLGE